MESFGWSPEMSLGVPAMDDAHKEFVHELAQLVCTPDGEFGDALFELIAKIERDFREEEALMEEIDFPALQSHREQHARVLSALHHVVSDVKLGGCASARRVIELLPQWFQFHLSTMDMALAVALDMEDVRQPPPAMQNP